LVLSTDFLGELDPYGNTEFWEYEKNKAFIAGVIIAGRECILKTPIENYNKDYITGTFDELLWLQDHGYSPDFIT